jgi:hypothetical protein
MATIAEHAQQAAHNENFLNSIDRAAFPDWVVTAAFYKAVHLAEGLLVRKSRKSGSHVLRNSILKRHFATVWAEYRPIYNQSRVARYWCVHIPSTEVDQAIVRLRAVETAIAAIP